MKKLLGKIHYRLSGMYWRWKVGRPQKCATIGKDYAHKIDVIGEIVETDHRGWVKYGCPTARTWCIENEIYHFDIVERYINSIDYKIHFVFAFKNVGDATAFRLGYL